jgi:hypothetical protein
MFIKNLLFRVGIVFILLAVLVSSVFTASGSAFGHEFVRAGSSGSTISSPTNPAISNVAYCTGSSNNPPPFCDHVS